MEHITLKHLAEDLGMDRSNLRKYVLAEGLEPFTTLGTLPATVKRRSP